MNYITFDVSLSGLGRAGLGPRRKTTSGSELFQGVSVFLLASPLPETGLGRYTGADFAQHRVTTRP